MPDAILQDPSRRGTASKQNIRKLTGPLRDSITSLAIPPRDNVPALDVLRSAAILLVFATHFSGEFHASAFTLRLPFVYYGWTGVDLFFVLSGFLIGGQLWKELDKTSGVKVGTFLLRRGLRIWPLYFSYVLLLLSEVVFAGRPFSGLQSDITFLSNYFHCQIGGGWSLSTEEQFYILAPVSLALLAGRVSVRRLWVVPALGLSVPILARKFIAMHSSLKLADLQQTLYFPFHTHADGLAVGMLIAWIAVLRADQFKRRRIVCPVLMMIAGAVLYMVDHIVFAYTSLALIFGALTWFGAASRGLDRLFRLPGSYVTSRLSYGLYLCHFGILPRLYKVLEPLRNSGGEITYWLCFVIALGLCLLFAAMTFCLIEHPFLKLRSRWLENRRQSLPRSVPDDRRVAVVVPCPEAAE